MRGGSERSQLKARVVSSADIPSVPRRHHASASRPGPPAPPAPPRPTRPRLLRRRRRPPRGWRGRPRRPRARPLPPASRRVVVVVVHPRLPALRGVPRVRRERAPGRAPDVGARAALLRLSRRARFPRIHRRDPRLARARPARRAFAPETQRQARPRPARPRPVPARHARPRPDPGVRGAPPPRQRRRRRGGARVSRVGDPRVRRGDGRGRPPVRPAHRRRERGARAPDAGPRPERERPDRPRVERRRATGAGTMFRRVVWADGMVLRGRVVARA